MFWKNIFGRDLIEFMNNINLALKNAFNNINENNLNLNYLEFKDTTTAPTPKPGRAIIYKDASGNLKILFPDGTEKTFTLT